MTNVCSTPDDLTRRIRNRVAIALFATLVLAACGGSSDESTPAPEGPTDPPEATAEAAPTVAATTEPSPTPEPTPTAEPAGRATIDDLLAIDEPLSIAHAGGDQEAPHSTFFAYDQAVASGAHVLEMDVLLTADGEVIVQHDDTVDRTTEASGPVSDLTLAEIQALDNAHWFSPQCWPCQDRPVEEYVYRGVRTGDQEPPPGASADDFRVVTLAEMAERYPTFAFDIEIKGDPEAALEVAAALASEIDRLDLTDSVVVVSFDDAALAAFEAAAPDVETSPAVGELTAWLLGGQPLEGHRIVQVPPEFQGTEVLNPAFWEAAELAGVSVWVWPSDAGTQENTEFYAQVISDGADGVIVGRPTQMP